MIRIFERENNSVFFHHDMDLFFFGKGSGESIGILGVCEFLKAGRNYRV